MPSRQCMPMAVDDYPLDECSDGPSPERSALKAVLAVIGRSPEVLRVVVRPLWRNHFRVNVFVGASGGSASIAHSYFVEVGEAGDIRSASPPLPGRTADVRR